MPWLMDCFVFLTFRTWGTFTVTFRARNQIFNLYSIQNLMEKALIVGKKNRHFVLLTDNFIILFT